MNSLPLDCLSCIIRFFPLSNIILFIHLNKEYNYVLSSYNSNNNNCFTPCERTFALTSKDKNVGKYENYTNKVNLISTIENWRLFHKQAPFLNKIIIIAKYPELILDKSYCLLSNIELFHHLTCININCCGNFLILPKVFCIVSDHFSHQLSEFHIYFERSEIIEYTETQCKTALTALSKFIKLRKLVLKCPSEFLFDVDEPESNIQYLIKHAKFINTLNELEIFSLLSTPPQLQDEKQSEHIFSAYKHLAVLKQLNHLLLDVTLPSSVVAHLITNLPNLKSFPQEYWFNDRYVALQPVLCKYLKIESLFYYHTRELELNNNNDNTDEEETLIKQQQILHDFTLINQISTLTELYPMDTLDNSKMFKLLNNLTNLRILNLENVYLDLNALNTGLLDSFPKLEKLTMNDYNIDSEGIIRLSQSCGKTLQYLTVCNVPDSYDNDNNNNNDNNTGFDLSLLQRFPILKSLCLGPDLTWLNDELFTSLIQNWPSNLRKLRLLNSPNITDISILTLANSPIKTMKLAEFEFSTKFAQNFTLNTFKLLLHRDNLVELLLNKIGFLSDEGDYGNELQRYFNETVKRDMKLPTCIITGGSNIHDAM